MPVVSSSGVSFTLPCREAGEEGRESTLWVVFLNLTGTETARSLTAEDSSPQLPS